MRLLTTDRERVQADFDGRRRRHDAHARWVCLVAAWIYAFCISLPTSFVETACAPGLAFLLLLPCVNFRVLLHLFAQPLTWVAFGLAAWMALSLTWSRDPVAGALELSELRWAWAGLILWPAMECRRSLIAAYCAGLLAGNIAQAAHGLGVSTGVQWLTWGRMPDRNSGWWDPAVAGTLLTAGFGVHLAGLVLGSTRRERGFGAAGASITALALLATGTRGAWIATAALAAIVLGIGGWRVRARVGRTRLLIGGAIALLLGAGAWLTVGHAVVRRAQAGVQEVSAAIDRREFSSDTGARLLMAWWAVEAFAERPLSGQGAGAYRAWCQSNLERRAIEPTTRRLHAHAHNALLHALATLGLPGAGLLGAVFLLAVRDGLRRDGQPGARESGYMAGPAVGVAGLALVSLFDTVQVNQQTGAHLLLLVAMCLRARPLQRPIGGFLAGKESRPVPHEVVS